MAYSLNINQHAPHDGALYLSGGRTICDRFSHQALGVDRDKAIELIPLTLSDNGNGSLDSLLKSDLATGQIDVDVKLKFKKTDQDSYSFDLIVTYRPGPENPINEYSVRGQVNASEYEFLKRYFKNGDQLYIPREQVTRVNPDIPNLMLYDGDHMFSLDLDNLEQTGAEEDTVVDVDFSQDSDADPLDHFGIGVSEDGIITFDKDLDGLVASNRFGEPVVKTVSLR